MMKAKLFILLIFLAAVCTRADTTISSSKHNAYGANTGWVEARGDVANGAVIGQSFCSGSIYSANCGWISLGSGPTNGWQYSNLSSDDFGVNHDGAGNLTGYAYGANIGWIQFEADEGRPRINFKNGKLNGEVWSANTGWISLSGVTTDSMEPGPDSDGDGIPDAWEYRMAGGLTALSDAANHDEDLDGIPDVDEYAADTDPLDDTDVFIMVDLQCPSNDTDELTWTIEPTRRYQVLYTDSLTNPVASWSDSGLGTMDPDSGEFMTRQVTMPPEITRFYRIKAVLPLSP